MAEICGVKIFQPQFIPSNGNSQPTNCSLWKRSTLASSAKAARITLQRLCEVIHSRNLEAKVVSSDSLSPLNSVFSLLPPELTERILSFLPATSLLACCQVQIQNVEDRNVKIAGVTTVEGSGWQLERILASSGETYRLSNQTNTTKTSFNIV